MELENTRLDMALQHEREKSQQLNRECCDARQASTLYTCTPKKSAWSFGGVQRHPPAAQNASRKYLGDKNKEVRGWQNLVDFLCLKCSKTRVQASLIPKFSWGWYPRTPVKNAEGQKVERERETGEGAASWLSVGWTPLWFFTFGKSFIAMWKIM